MSQRIDHDRETAPAGAAGGATARRRRGRPAAWAGAGAALAAAACCATVLPAAPADARAALGHCAQTRPAKAPVARDRHGRLVPGKPVAVRLCDYRPSAPAPALGGDQGTTSGTTPASTSPGAPGVPGELLLARSGSSHRRATVRRLARRANGLTKLPPVMRCPSDDGSVTILTFRYRHGRDRTVVAGRSGCRLARRGLIVRLGLGHRGKVFLHAVDALLR